jgi:sec-independent protein translocase protein TatA
MTVHTTTQAATEALQVPEVASILGTVQVSELVAALPANIGVPMFVGGLPGGPEMLIILLIAVLLFGANKIPKLARSSGEAIGEFKRGRQELEAELQDDLETDNETTTE